MRRRSMGGRAGAAMLAFVLASMAAPLPVGAGATTGAPASSAATAIRNAVSAVHGAPPLDILSPTPGGLVPNGGVGVRSVANPAKPPATPTEVSALRSEFQRVTANPNGTFTAQVSLGRINYRDAAGAWQPIDTTRAGRSISVYRQLLPDGRQVWVEVRNGTTITNGCVNEVPR